LILINDPVYFIEVVDGLTGGGAFRQKLTAGKAMLSLAVHFHTTELALPFSRQFI
jgi:hypothetical protein